eukprot:Em0001g3237a
MLAREQIHEVVLADLLLILFSMQCWGHRFLSRSITSEIQNCVLYWNAIAGHDCLMEPFQDLYYISSGHGIELVI